MITGKFRLYILKGGMWMFIEYLRFLESKESKDFQSIIDHCEKYIRYETSIVGFNHQDDFRQVLLMKLYNMVNKRIITLNDDFVFDLESNTKYFSKFIGHTGKARLSLLESKNLVESEYFLFIGEIKLRMYIKRVCFTTRIDFYRENDKSFLSNCISLNSATSEGVELIERIPMKDESVNNELLRIDLTSLLHKTEYDFLMKYTQFENQKKYAEYLGVSQQYISKKIKSIRKRVKKGRTRECF